MKNRIWSNLVICLSLLGGFQAVEGQARVVDFEREVRPILSQNCFTCHGPDEAQRRAGLRLDVEQGLHADRGRAGGPVVVPGEASESLLYQRLLAESERQRMPRDADRLTDEEIQTLGLWIDQGAEWKNHWAFVVPRKPALPPVREQDWVRNPIDTFVLARLEEDGIQPAREADRATLLRRVTLDLTGLPPSLEEVDSFLADDSPNAYERVVDRLLESSRYGERMAVEWLDAARYADTNGYQTDGERTMWRWRDWVIDAYNDNMPFDQFTIEQIAGDMLTDATLDQRIATGFNRNHSLSAEGGIVPEEFLVEYAVDRVSTVGTVWLGLTLGCARCHDHKFDPITQTEFYEVFAHFNNIPERGKGFKYVNSPPFITAPTHEQQEELAGLDRRLAEAYDAFQAFEGEVLTLQREWEDALGSSNEIDWNLRDGLLVYHALDGDLGGMHAGQAVDASLEDGLPRFVEGRRGLAASFDGQRFIDAGPSPNLGYDDSFTLSAWLYPTATDGVVLSRAREGDQGEVGWGLYLEAGKVRLNLSTRILDDGVAAETIADLPLNEWHHLLATYDGSKTPGGMRVYVDGESWELTPLLDLVGNRLPQRQPLRIGASGSTKPRFQGHIDDVRIYGRVLTPQEAAVVASPESVSEIARLSPEQRSDSQREKLRLSFLHQYAPAEVREAFQRLRELERQREGLWKSFPTVMVMQEMEEARPTFRLNRGQYDNPAEPVSPDVPSVLPPLPDGAEKNRLSFARWLVDPANPLTARVTVNRFWQMYFGIGLVKTAENFGAQGEYPSYPEILDWLAATFVESGWDIKEIQRAIVTSATYRQSSALRPELLEQDPENRLLARGTRFRLPAQMIRDQALAVSGLYTERIGGPSVGPYQPEGLWDDIVERGQVYRQSEGEDLYRRSLYTFTKRTRGPPAMIAFDAATREYTVVRPTRTNTPLQALNLMNDVAYVEASRVLGERMIHEGGSTPRDRLLYAYRLATAREPSPQALNILEDAFRGHFERYQVNREDALLLVTVGDSERDESLDVAELAAYQMVASLILNLDETLTRH